MASASGKEETKGKRGASAGKPSLNMDELRELADLIEARGFTDFEFENEKIRVRMSKNVVGPAPAAPPAVVQPTAAPAPAGPATPNEAEPEAASTDADDDLHKITSPIVGTFYRSPGPDKDPFVDEGAEVSEDSVVCIVEAMKLMNEIQAEVSGEVVKIYVENGQPVEYGQPLFGIKQ